MKKILLLFALCLLLTGTAPLSAQDIKGSWRGTLDLGVQKLRLVFNITETDDKCTATMDSPDQSVAGIPVSSVHFDGKTLEISDNTMGLTFEGELTDGMIKGMFRQAGINIPLVLERGTFAEEKPARPQMPEPPYPYNSEDVFFENKEAGITLAGTFTWPATGKKFPAVILISGSGPQNRDEELVSHKPFLLIADHLTRNGIAVLRFDDRGTAASGGDYDSATIQDFATDASAAMDYLKSRNEVDRRKIGLLGHSEGGQIAFIVGGDRKDVAFIVTLAGPGVDGASLLKEQRRVMMSLQGASQEVIDRNEEIIDIMYSVLDKYGYEEVESNLDHMVAEAMSMVSRDYPYSDILEDALRRDFPRFSSPELRSLEEYDPACDLAKIKAPILALNGDKDVQVPADMNLGGIKERFGGDLTTKKYPGLNHLLQHAGTGLPTEYGQIEETMSPEVLEDIASWINFKTKNKNVK